jgi:hypothetical protein
MMEQHVIVDAMNGADSITAYSPEEWAAVKATFGRAAGSASSGKHHRSRVRIADEAPARPLGEGNSWGASTRHGWRKFLDNFIY